MSVNRQFRADVQKFAAVLNAKVSEALGAITVNLHGHLVEMTPLRSGRARASWNIAQGDVADLSVPPEHPGNRWEATPQQIAAAIDFYKTYENRQRRFVPYEGTITIDGQVHSMDVFRITNNLFYIERLNTGSSSQAPAGFFQLAVLDIEGIVSAQITSFGNKG